MPRWLKVIVWIVVFGACAGVGAYVAAHTDPFPPGVDDPGARDTPSPDASLIGPPEEAPAQRWLLSLRSDSEHVFRVGGSCRTSWRAALEFRVDAGTVEGSGEAVLAKPRSCDFTVAQVQTEHVRLELTGSSDGRRIEIGFRVAGVDPVASDDAGGFVGSIGSDTFTLREGEPVNATVAATDGRGGTFRSTVSLQARCVAGCEA